MTGPFLRWMHHVATPSRIHLAALLLLVLSSTAHAQRHIDHAECCGRPDVILIRGGMGYWPGVKALAEDFTELGYAPTIIHGYEHVATAKRIACAARQGKMTAGVVIVGYSSGADAACLLARRLDKCGVRVQTMVLIESTLGTPVPGNVDYCINYYIPRALDAIPIFRGVEVENEGACTTLINVNLKDCPAFESHFKRNHLVISSTCAMRKMATDVVVSRHPIGVMTPVEFPQGELLPPGEVLPPPLPPIETTLNIGSLPELPVPR